MPTTTHDPATAPDLPPALAEVALIPAATCAAAMGCSASQWYAILAEDPEAPAPVIREPRFVRWLAKDVSNYLRKRIERAAANNAKAAEALTARAKLASVAAKAKREAKRNSVVPA